MDQNVVRKQPANAEDATISGIIAGEYVPWVFMSCRFRIFCFREKADFTWPNSHVRFFGLGRLSSNIFGFFEGFFHQLLVQLWDNEMNQSFESFG